MVVSRFTGINVRGITVIAILVIVVILGLVFLSRGPEREERAIRVVRSYGRHIGGPRTIEDVIEDRVEWLNVTGERDFAYGEWKIFGWRAERDDNIYLVGCEIRCETSFATHSYTYEWEVNLRTGEVVPLNEGAENIQAVAERS